MFNKLFSSTVHSFYCDHKNIYCIYMYTAIIVWYTGLIQILISKNLEEIVVFIVSPCYQQLVDIKAIKHDSTCENTFSNT